VRDKIKELLDPTTKKKIIIRKLIRRLKAAENLHGKLLIIHGTTDDNVHIENTFKLVNALQQADKEFELMIYPKSRHGIGGMHYNCLVVDFIKTVLELDD